MRAPPPLLRWADHDPAAWHVAVAEAEALRREAPRPIIANDLHPAAVALARRDAHAAGVTLTLTLTRTLTLTLTLTLTPTLALTLTPIQP